MGTLTSSPHKRYWSAPGATEAVAPGFRAGRASLPDTQPITTGSLLRQITS